MPKEVKIPSAADSKKESWWQTLPGMLTATAGIITAVGGLLLVLHQVGLLGGKSAPAAPAATSQSVSDSTTPISSPAASASNDTKYSVTFPSGTTVKFHYNRGGQGTYQILTAQAERRSVGKLGLTFTIRMTNNGPIDAGFYTDTFRLLVDGVPRVPVNRLNDIVDARSAKESDIEFEMPDNAKSLALQVLVGDKPEDTADIAIILK